MWREISSVAKALNHFGVSENDLVVDMPCGTGIAGAVLSRHPVRTLAMDISQEMMHQAAGEYTSAGFMGFVQADITKMPLADKAVTGFTIIGFMHRVPVEIKRATLDEVARICERFVVVSFTVDTAIQRLKKKLFSIFLRRHSSAPAPMPLAEIRKLVESSGFVVRKVENIAPPVSGEVVLWLEKLTD